VMHPGTERKLHTCLFALDVHFVRSFELPFVPVGGPLAQHQKVASHDRVTAPRRVPCRAPRQALDG
jgi:hypothetical protein